MSENTLTTSEFETIVNAIAAELDGNWKVNFNAEDWSANNMARLERAAGNVTIAIYHPQYRDTSRLTISADWGQDTCSRLRHNIDATVSITRTPAAIARDITRRVIDPFIPYLNAARKEYAAEQQRVTDGQALATKIGGFLNSTTTNHLTHRGTPGREHDHHAPEADFNVRYQPTITVSARLTNLTPEQGLALAAWVQANITDAK